MVGEDSPVHELREMAAVSLLVELHINATYVQHPAFKWVVSFSSSPTAQCLN